MGSPFYFVCYPYMYPCGFVALCQFLSFFTLKKYHVKRSATGMLKPLICYKAEIPFPLKLHICAIKRCEYEEIPMKDVNLALTDIGAANELVFDRMVKEKERKLITSVSRA